MQPKHFYSKNSGDVAVATKFGENEQKLYENGDNLSCEQDIELKQLYTSFVEGIGKVIVSLQRTLRYITERVRGHCHGNQIKY